jgi:hypothetical protein
MKPMYTPKEPWRRPAPIVWTEVRMPLPDGPFSISLGAFNPPFEVIEPYLSGVPIRRPSRRAKLLHGRTRRKKK